MATVNIVYAAHNLCEHWVPTVCPAPVTTKFSSQCYIVISIHREGNWYSKSLMTEGNWLPFHGDLRSWIPGLCSLTMDFSLQLHELLVDFVLNFWAGYLWDLAETEKKIPVVIKYVLFAIACTGPLGTLYVFWKVGLTMLALISPTPGHMWSSYLSFTSSYDFRHMIPPQCLGQFLPDVFKHVFAFFV